MSGPTTRHFVIAALVLFAAAALVALCAVRYIDHGQERKLSAFQALAFSLDAATAVDGDDDESLRVAMQRWWLAWPEAPAPLALRFVRKGSQVPGLGISKPARVVVDFNSLDPDESVGRTEETERLAALCARLDQHFARGGTVEELEARTLTWLRAAVGATAASVAAYPALAPTGELLGLAVAEAPFVPLPGPSPLLALAWIAAAAALFGLLHALTRRSRLALAAVALAAVLASTAFLWRYNETDVQSFSGRRGLAVTHFVETKLFSRPDALVALDSLWNRVFKSPADGLALAAAEPTRSWYVTENAAARTELVWNRTFPVVLLLLFVLGLAVAVLPSFGNLVWGITRMPGVYAYVAPAMIGMVVLVLVPFVMGVALGFFNQDFEFVGLGNFADILFPRAESDTNFYFTLGVTVLWTIANVATHVALGLLLALMLVSSKVRFRGLFRVLLIIPWAVPNYITALVWKWMFTSEIGAINLMLSALGVDNPPAWFGPSFWTNFFAALATNIWLGFPFMMVVSMGALQSIPADLYEAADIDGASRWQKFTGITLPLLKPALFPAVILGSIWTFNMFNIIYLVTRGRPDNKTNILITEAYRFFAELNQYGVAAAYCVMIFVILLLYTLITNRVTRATQGAFE